MCSWMSAKKSKKTEHKKVAELKRELVFLRADTTRLQEQNAHYQRLVEGVVDGLWCRDLSTGQLWLSDNWASALGYTNRELPLYLDQLAARVHPADRAEFQAAITRYLAGLSPTYRSKFRLKHKDGTFRTVLSQGRKLPVGSPEPQWFAGVHTDITETQSRLDMFELTFNSVPHLILVKDKDGKFLWVNQAIADFYGAKREEMRGKMDRHYNSNEDQLSKFAEDDRTVIQKRRVVHVEKETNTDSQGKPHFLNTIKVPLIHPDGEVDVVVVATIIDEVVKLEERLSHQRLQTRKHRDLVLLAGKCAHKLNTRIAIAETLACSLPDDASGLTGELLNAVDDLKRFSTSFQQLALSNEVKHRHTTLPTILRRAIQVAKEDQATVTFQGNPLSAWTYHNPMWDVDADEDKLVDVFSELFANARRASAATGVALAIAITVSPIPEVPPISMGPARHPVKLKVSFADNAGGIPAKLKSTLFDAFVSGNTEGDGLGLAMVQEVVQAHGGTIHEKSDATHPGAVFELILPTKLESHYVNAIHYPRS